MTILGIDFGTSNSCISYYKDSSNTIEIIPNKDGEYTTPSCIFFDNKTDEILIGNSALGQCLESGNSNVIYNIKRLLGVSYKKYKESMINEFFNMYNLNIIDDKNGLCSIIINEKIYSIEDLTKIYIKYLINISEEYLCETINNVIITIPSYFSNLSREIMLNIFKSLNINVLRILNEPTSAALAYIYYNESGYLTTNDNNILVLDCGGGTTDISLLNIDLENGIYEVCESIGDNYLGGEDLTNNLYKYIISKFFNNTQFNCKQKDRLIKECERVKKYLSYHKSCGFYWQDNLICDISQAQFIEINKSFFEKIQNMIMSIKIGYNISKIIFTGGTTKIPYFKTTINNIFKDANNFSILNSLNPDYTVSIGATLFSKTFITNKVAKHDDSDYILIDILPFSLGVEIDGGLMCQIISKNSQLPVSKSMFFTNTLNDTVSDTEIEINIYRGNRRFVKDNEYLDTLYLKNNSLKKTGEMKIKIVFSVDINSVLHIEASEIGSDNNINNKIIESFTKFKENDIDDYIIEDSIKTLQIIEKLKLNTEIKKLKNIYEQMKTDTFNDTINNNLEIMFEKYHSIIQNYIDYDVKQLQQFNIQIFSDWHSLVTNVSYIHDVI